MNRFSCDSLMMTTDEFMIDLREQLVLAARRCALLATRGTLEALSVRGPASGQPRAEAPGRRVATSRGETLRAERQLLDCSCPGDRPVDAFGRPSRRQSLMVSGWRSSNGSSVST